MSTTFNETADEGIGRGAGSVTANTNSWLTAAKANKQDEFYTQLSDIENELRNFRRHFKGKVVLCNCDDPYESDFFKYFVINFRRLGIKKLIASCYSGSPVAGAQLAFSELEGLTDEEAAAKQPYKIEITEIPDADGDGSIGLPDVEYLLRHDANILTPLKGDGDFRSAECMAVLDEADIVVTNPPFSLMTEYLITLLNCGKSFIILGNINQAMYSDLFSFIQDGRIWLGANSGHFWFRVPDHYEPKTTDYRQDADGQKWRRMGGICWFTNLDHPKRHETLVLVERYTPEKYPAYDNFDAIEVSRTVDIPEDWEGVMGVPITFLDKYNPEQFEIVGVAKTWYGGATKIYPAQTQVSANGQVSTVSKLNDGAVVKVDSQPVGKTHYIIDGEYYLQKYARLLIRRIGATS
ncbi:adenine-specific methyltransferase EcoRI family protein [soil metagenome]